MLHTIFFPPVPQPCPSLFRPPLPATSRGPPGQPLPPLPCCLEHCTPQTPPSWAAGRSQSPCPSSPAGQGPLWLSHPGWWGLQSVSPAGYCCRERRKGSGAEHRGNITCTMTLGCLGSSSASSMPATPRTQGPALPCEAQPGPLATTGRHKGRGEVFKQVWFCNKGQQKPDDDVLIPICPLE